MEFKQSTSILFSNFGLVFKILLYVLIATLIFVSLSSAIVIPAFRSITANESMGYLLDNTQDDLEVFLQGDESIITTYEKLSADFNEILSNFLAAKGTIAGVCIGMFLLIMLYRFLVAMSFLPTSDILNNFMSSNLRYGFMSNFTLNFSKSTKFALLKILVFLPIDIIIIVVLGGTFIGLWQIIKMFAMPIVLVLGIFLLSLRQSIFSGWIPRMIFHPEEKIRTALKNGFNDTKEYRKNLTASFAIIYFLYWALTGALSTATFGIMALIAPAMNYVITRIVELVNFYKINGLRFYTDSNTVVDTGAVGMRTENQESRDLN